MAQQNLCLKQSRNMVTNNKSADLTSDVRSADYFLLKEWHTIEFRDVLKLNAVIAILNVEK